MREVAIETDYLIVGSGAAGMAFADAMVEHSDADIVMVDSRHAPGGHWVDAYPFVRLHQPSAFYGVNSTPLGEDKIDKSGSNAGMFERASGSEIVGYYRRVMDHRLLASGRVRYLPMCNYLGQHQFVSRTSGQLYRVKVRKKLVDATYLQPRIPANYPAPFEVAAGIRCVPVNQLAEISEAADRYIIIGGGKTGIDACQWLLENGVAPEDISWVRPRDSWLANRKTFQPGELAFESFSLMVEAASQAETPDDFIRRLTANEQFFNMDAAVAPTMFKYATVNQPELDMIRSVKDVVRLGRIQRIELDKIVCDQGSIPTGPGNLHIHCAAPGLNLSPAVPIFAEDKITLQAIRPGSTPFAAAITAYIETTRDDVALKNKLCPANPFMDVPAHLIRTTLISLNADYQWNQHADISEWLSRSRLNLVRGIAQQQNVARVQRAMKRFSDNAPNAVANLQRLQKMLA